ncbi:MAG: polyprenol monophosphomannose synthase [Actinomycetota bacterium]|nr:polyprenol monophosphomannose synthase [Actinomycetota bacterium]
MPTFDDVWLVLPTYNEARNLEGIVAAALAALPTGARVLIVDDSSPDGTGRIATGLAAGSDAIDVLHRDVKEGLGPAYVAGFRHVLDAGAGLVVQMDADFSHDPADIPRLLAAAKDADLVIGSRYVAGGSVADWGPIRRGISRSGSAYARKVLGVEVRDLTGGFKAVHRRVMAAIDLESIASLGYAFQVELTYRAIQAGFRVAEVPITFRDRRIGQSKMTGGIVLEAALGVPRMRFRRP